MFQTAVDASRLSARKLRTTQCYFKSKKKKDKKERKKIELEVSRINPFRVFCQKECSSVQIFGLCFCFNGIICLCI